MQTPKALEKAKATREAHKRACTVLATTVVVLGGIMGVELEMHGAGLVVEIVGLYLVSLV